MGCSIAHPCSTKLVLRANRQQNNISQPFRHNVRQKHGQGSIQAVATPAARNNGSDKLPTQSVPTSPAEVKERAPYTPAYIANILVSCPDAKGVVASLSQLLYGVNANILQSDQFSDLEGGKFYQRLTIDYSDLLVGPGNTQILETGIAEVAKRYSMDWKISYRSNRKRVAILVSKLDHCLYDLLIRHESGELDCDISIVISNWPDLEPVAAKFGIPFKHLPIKPKDADSKAAQEAQIEALIKELDIDVLILARYMQIFSKDFASRYWRQTINVHHALIPSFLGSKPYHRAHEAGVKIIGATAHFATPDLDCGPIIDQDVIRVSHKDSVSDLVRKGRDLERIVLSRALRWYLQDRIIVTDESGKTVVFED